MVTRFNQNRPLFFVFPQMWVKPRKIERLGLPDATLLPFPGGVAPELDQSRLVGMQLQAELREPFAKVSKEPLRVSLMLETGNKVIGETDDDHVTVRVPTSPLPGPPVEDIMQIDIGEQRRDRRSLRCPGLARRPLPVLDDPCPHPLADETQNPLVRYAMLEKLL